MLLERRLLRIRPGVAARALRDRRAAAEAERPAPRGRRIVALPSPVGSLRPRTAPAHL